MRQHGFTPLVVADTREERDAAVDTESGAFELVSSLLPH